MKFLAGRTVFQKHDNESGKERSDFSRFEQRGGEPTRAAMRASALCGTVEKDKTVWYTVKMNNDNHVFFADIGKLKKFGCNSKVFVFTQ